MNKRTNDAFVKALRDAKYQSAYINIARMGNGDWIVCWNSKYFGAERRHEAVRLRCLWLDDLQKYGSNKWKAHHLKTIKIL